MGLWWCQLLDCHWHLDFNCYCDLQTADRAGFGNVWLSFIVKGPLEIEPCTLQWVQDAPICL